MIGSETATLKREVIQALDRLPDDLTLDDIIDCAILVSKVRCGVAQLERGETITHEDVKRQLSRWLR